MTDDNFEVISLDKTFYMKPDEYLNGWAKKCGWQATLVYDSLWRHADRSREAFPSVQRMAEEHGVSEDTISRGIKVLEEYHIINKEKKTDPDTGRFLHNTYILLAKKHWVEPIHTAVSGMESTPLSAETHTAVSGTKDTHIKYTHIPPIVPQEGDGLDKTREEARAKKEHREKKKLGFTGFTPKVKPSRQYSEDKLVDCPNVAEGHQGCIDYIDSLKDVYGKVFTNRPLQFYHLHSILKAGYTFPDIDKVIQFLDDSQYYIDNGWDMQTVSNLISKGGNY